MLKHSLLALTLIAGAAQAAVENGSLNFNWQGTTPATPVTPASWKFVDALGADYTPTTSTLNMSIETDGSLQINSAANHSFFIDVTGTLTGINAYLASTPVSSGFVASKQLALATAAIPANDQVAILMNNQPLKVGSANKIALGGTGNLRSVDISLVAKAAASTFAENTVIGFSVPVIFAVDITT